MSRSSFGSRSSFNTGRKLSRETRKEHNSRNDHSMHEKRQRSRHNNTEAEKAARSIFGDVPLTDTERRYLWSAQSGNLPALESIVEDAGSFNLCCRDYLGRTALQLSVLGEHYDCIQLLLNKLRADIIEEGLLHSIKANNVKICDMFLSHPLYSDYRSRTMPQMDYQQNWYYEKEDSSSSFANDITPIVLAAQCNNFDIVHMLIQKGFTIPTPHNYFCLCPECQTFKDQDRVVHSKSRLNAYRGLASTAYLSLSCDDPIYAAFELSRNLEKLAEREKEHKSEYRGLSNQCKDFAVALLDQCRTNEEVMSALHGGTDTTDLARIKMAIRYDQKKFIAHASCQEQLASMWYSGAPWFQHQSFVIRLLMVPFGILFIPLTAIIYVFVPYSKLGRVLKSPFMKFMNYICSYMAFLVLLFLSTQLTSFQNVHLFNGVEGVVNGLIMFYVLGMFWAECKQLWEEGVRGYFSQMWNYMDITMLALYTAGYSTEGVIYTKAHGLVSNNHLLHSTDKAILSPQILSKILFSVANVMSFARIAYILPASETFGQLQISYGRMLQDVGKFIFIYVTVMVAFICGLTSLYSISTNTNFSGLSQTTGTLFWAAFGLGNAKAPQIVNDDNHNIRNNNNVGGRGGGVRGSSSSRGSSGGSMRVGGDSGGGGDADEGMTEEEMLEVVQMVGYILYSVYIIGAVVVLINMLIAMMSNTFEEIQKSEDCEWKFARAKLWISFIEQGTTLPIPFNIIPTPKSIVRLTRVIKNSIRCRQGKFDPSFEDGQRCALEYKAIMHRVVLRYIHMMKFEKREDSLKDEILDTREEVLYQMHSMMGKFVYRMEIIENDLLAISKNLTLDGISNQMRSNLSYSRSVPSHVRNPTNGNTSSVGIDQLSHANLRRGRSYYHDRPKHKKLSDHSIRYNQEDRPCVQAPVSSNNNQQTFNEMSVSNHVPLTSPPATIVSNPSNTCVTTVTTRPSQHGNLEQGDSQGQGCLSPTDVTLSTSGVKTVTDTTNISTISGSCFNDVNSPNPSKDREMDLLHRRVDSIRIRGSYSPRPGEDRPRLSDSGRKREVVGSNPPWAQDVIEESWLEDQHAQNQQTQGRNPMDVKAGLGAYGSVRRRRETVSHPNIDAPFRPISEDNQRNTFTEYCYTKPKRRETIQNLILDVNNMPIAGMDRVGPGGRKTGDSGAAPTRGCVRTGTGGDGGGSVRSSVKSLGSSSGSHSNIMAAIHPKDLVAVPTPRSAEERRDAPWFNWSQAPAPMYGKHSQEDLFYPMRKMISQNPGDINVVTKSNSVPNNEGSINFKQSGINRNDNGTIPDLNTDRTFDRSNSNQTTGSSYPSINTSVSELSCNSTKTRDDIQETSLSYCDDVTQNTNSDMGQEIRMMDPLTLSETEIKSSNASKPRRKIGIVDMQIMNPIMLDENSFFGGLCSANNKPRNENKRDMVRQEAAVDIRDASQCPSVERVAGNSNVTNIAQRHAQSSQSENSHSNQSKHSQGRDESGFGRTVPLSQPYHFSSENVSYAEPHPQDIPADQRLPISRLKDQQKSYNIQHGSKSNLSPNSENKISDSDDRAVFTMSHETQTSPIDDVIDFEEAANRARLSGRHFSDSSLGFPRLYHIYQPQNHRYLHAPMHVFTGGNMSDQRLNLINTSRDLSDSMTHLTRQSVRFDEGDHACHENRAYDTSVQDDFYIPPMASNLIPFAVVPNTTPIHHHAPEADPGEQTACGQEVKRKTSSGKKLSLASLVRGRRSDKVKEKSSDDVKHNRSLSLNRFTRVERLKQLQPQRSKEI